MRSVLSLKTLYRSPVRTLLTFILLGVVTFAFFTQTAEYAITTREFKNAAKQYCGVGSAEIAPPGEAKAQLPSYINADPRMPELSKTEKESFLNTSRYQPLTLEQIGEISTLPYITSVDTRYMTAGVSNTYFRLDDGQYFFNYTARCVIEGTLKRVNLGEPPENPQFIGINNNFNQLVLEDCTVLAGNSPWATGQEVLPLYVHADFQRHEQVSGVTSVNGELARRPWFCNQNYIYDTAYLQNLTLGNRYVVVIRYEPLQKEKYNTVFLYDHLTEPWCGAIWPVDGAPDNYLETEKYAPLKKLIEVTNDDIHTFDIVYTDDMRAILRFARGDMEILDGRALNRVDSTSGAAVCVVSREFAKANQINVGDSITMKLGTELFEQYKGLGAVAVTQERYKPAEKPVTLEIVGIYTDTDGPSTQKREPNWNYSINTIFVPKSLLPVDESQLADHVFTPAEYSFLVGNAWDIPAFLEKTAPRFAEMGLTFFFSDDGWPDIAQGFQSARSLSFVKIAVLSAAVAAATGFVVYLFIGRKKKEYAVMRALGTTRKTAARSLILPLMSVAAVSVLVGSGVAWIYTVKTIARNNSLSLLKTYAVSTAVPAEAIIGCVVGEILLTLVIALLLLRRIGSLSPLSLLQDNSNKRGRGGVKTDSKKQTRLEAKTPVTASVLTTFITNLPQAGSPIIRSAVPGTPEAVREVNKDIAFVFILRYIWKHMRRAAGKSAMAVLLSVLLFIAIGQLALMKVQYTQLCADTVIKANFVGGLALPNISRAMKTGGVKDPYYEATAKTALNFAPTEIVITNNIARYVGEEPDITYADGYDVSCMNQFDETLIVGRGLMKMYDLELGGTAIISPDRFLNSIQSVFIAEYRAEHPQDDRTDEVLTALYQDEIIDRAKKQAATYTIAGVVSTPSGAYDMTMFTPGTADAPFKFTLDVVEFTLSDNLRADEFRAFGEKLARGGVTFVMDTSKLENLRNTLRLLETMYPIVMMAALLIGGFLCCLVIVQSSKEAAIMRILGTTKRKTRVILALEQLLLGIAGLVIGACGLLTYKGSSLSVVSAQLGLFAALYFAVILISAITFSVLATRRNVLELLQTKE